MGCRTGRWAATAGLESWQAARPPSACGISPRCAGGEMGDRPGQLRHPPRCGGDPGRFLAGSVDRCEGLAFGGGGHGGAADPLLHALQHGGVELLGQLDVANLG